MKIRTAAVVLLMYAEEHLSRSFLLEDFQRRSVDYLSLVEFAVVLLMYDVEHLSRSFLLKDFEGRSVDYLSLVEFLSLQLSSKIIYIIILCRYIWFN